MIIQVINRGNGCTAAIIWYRPLQVSLSILFVSDLHFELCDSSLQSEELLLEGSFLPLESCDLLLKPGILSFLVSEMPFHLLFYALELSAQGLSDVLCFHRQDTL